MSALAQGDLSPLLGWLRAKVHGKGSLLGFNDLLRAATGKPLDPRGFRGAPDGAVFVLSGRA